ncbi:uncharacterized protein LOC123506719 [Portunus trituberculatus]|uniref:uncharacterized protein LOC123506719 n=1 Tax=Portunus trituberculatus TaxID=210409 RepID=UPI001E1D0309|nr:uncharacterized protein LOC123506719 [Portunus trituberculatus]XP_045114919.1 uncharacterized protein LOC123506719 [Portunus trituberculatus]
MREVLCLASRIIMAAAAAAAKGNWLAEWMTVRQMCYVVAEWRREPADDGRKDTTAGVGDPKAVTAAIPCVLHHQGRTLASQGAVTDPLPITLLTPPSTSPLLPLLGGGVPPRIGPSLPSR